MMLEIHILKYGLPTMLRDKGPGKAEGDGSPFRYITQNLVTRLMRNRFFKENYCFVILRLLVWKILKLIL